MVNRICKAILISSSLILMCPLVIFGQTQQKIEKSALTKLKSWENPVKEWRYPSKIRPDSLKVSEADKSITFYFPVPLSYNAVREETTDEFTKSLSESLGRKFRNYNIIVITNGTRLEQLIPNYFRSNLEADSDRIHQINPERPVLIRKTDSYKSVKGLGNYNIALWHSHGYYFDMTLDRWEWQRAKLFGTVEDLSVMGYVLPYLTKMLENSGATVFLPRERDTQINEIVVDNDGSSGDSEFVIHVNGDSETINEGFLKCDTLFTGDNPFKKGTSLRIKNGNAEYVPAFTQGGYYSVYISYPGKKDNCRNASYIVKHTGGSTEFVIDQTIGGGTWIWLGTFKFDSGKNASRGAVVVRTDPGASLALDAVRFGGGMGNVARRPSSSIMSNQWSLNENAAQTEQQKSTDSISWTWKLSGKPRYYEGARYFLQYAGMPDTLVYSLNKDRNDYNDDYQSRGAWVNYLRSAPERSSDKQGPAGLGIPVDLALAFHTDAGVTPDDSIIGTLGIYSTASGEGKFPDGTSRLASRDLSDIIQTQVVSDISVLYNPEWTRRGLWDKSYSEARKPDVPAMLLELLSHQNMGDQRYGLDPRFRFDVCRAIYKGILRYLTFSNRQEYVIQPLPVNGLSLTHVSGKKVLLSWQPVSDPLEPSAFPSAYRVYMREGNNGFDNGIEVNGTSIEIELEKFDAIYSFKVTAVNEGGESFDSEVLATGLKDSADKPVLVVNGFDRISGPAWFDRGGIAGVEWWNDRGVPDHYEIVATGNQYDFDRNSPWVDDDAPGWGASYSDMEGKVIPGNSFDYPYIHGKAIMEAGSSFCSVSDEVFCSPDFDKTGYKFIDLVFGEEKTTPEVYDSMKVDFQIYTPGLMQALKLSSESGIPLFLSGAYVGTDLMIANDTILNAQVSEYLHFKPRTGHAVKNGSYYSTDIASRYFRHAGEFNTEIDDSVYGAESPDAIEPSDKRSVTAFRYAENNTSAGVICPGKNRTIVLGFPFETIKTEEQRKILMKQIIDFLTVL